MYNINQSGTKITICKNTIINQFALKVYNINQSGTKITICP